MKMMKENFKILLEFVKDMSSETPDVQSYLFVKDNISKYHLTININSNPLKNKLIEINTCLKFEDKENNEKRSLFEIVYASVVKIDDAIMNNKKELQKIILCDIQNKIYPNIEKAFQNLLTDSGFPDVKFKKKVDFNKLYNEQFT
jgi:preprotein translocase subunit SecB